MKNFGSILALLALSATVVSARALPDAEEGLEARAPFDIVSEMVARSPKKANVAANSTATAVTAATSGKRKKAKAAKGSNSTIAAGASTAAATGKKAKGTGAAASKTAKGSGAAKATATATATSASDTAGAADVAGGADVVDVVNALASGGASGLDAVEGELESVGINLALRDLPILEARKKAKNGTATATKAAKSGAKASKAAKATSAA